MVVVDSHHHLWDPVELDLSGLSGDHSVFHRACLWEELEQEIRCAGVDFTVCVQAYPQSAEGNRWLFKQANDAGFIAGVVAWADLTSPIMLGETLDDLQRHAKFVGIRHIVEAEPDPNWILRGTVMESLGELARRDIPYDMLVKPHHLGNVLRVIDKAPDLRMVIDHIAKPDIAHGGSKCWREDMAAIALSPKVYCKLSGMITEADWHNWRSVDFEPYVDHIVSIFGWDRVMFGSDWPVCLLAGSYRGVVDALNDALGEISEDNRRKVFGGNAVRFYKLRI